MIIGTGIDVVDIQRFERQLERTPRLIERLFAPSERELPVQSLAARFAAKEATAKALKAPPGMIWQHCWIEKTKWGAPVLRMEGTVAAEAAKQGIDRWHLSMSHDGGMAMAYVVAEGFPVDALPDAQGESA
ncbi:holo-ACP synthase [Kocuria sp. ZOR0020]|uniref:holo-ACP synthase n=1 Tax=Kocuria sp. ZOR0020 TaxID=1339234 RepID=UPI000647D8CC|nr:holo-ACP synthase [Kocuria sp. ZOR0020]